MMQTHERQQACEDCGIAVHFLQTICGANLPDFITCTWPDDAWMGWTWQQPPSERQPDEKPALVVLCSKSCLVHWFADMESPGA